MSSRPVPEGVRHLEELSSLEDRHRSFSFEDVRRAVLTEPSEGWPIFVEKYSRFVYSVALRLLSGPDEQKQDWAQEIYCEVFSRLQRNDHELLRRFESRCKFTTYLFRVVQTARASVLAAAIREAERIDFVDFCDEANRWIEAAAAREKAQEEPVPVLAPERLREAIARVTDALSPREKLLVKLRFQKGLKLREIASTLNYRDTNDAAYALKKALKGLESLAALEPNGWSEEESGIVLETLEKELFQ